MRELLRELGAMGKTVVVSSHILTELAELCDSVGIIDQGRLVASGSLDDIARRAHGGGLLQLHLLSDRGPAEALLREHPDVIQIYPTQSGFDIEFAGDDPAKAALLADLVDAGARIPFFGQTTSDLEEIFLQLTRA
jgi:ABC-2 type transport system ATP-binding protein